MNKNLTFEEKVQKVFGSQLKEIKLSEQQENTDVRDFLIMLNEAFAKTKKRNNLRFRIRQV